MIPKEKAIELVDNFRLNVLDYEGSGLNSFKAKQCALIAVDEILLGYMGNPKVKYWTEVKQELNKLSYDNIK
jgi:hypothetical protein